MATQEGSYMTVQGNNDIETEVDEDMALEKNAKMMQDNNEKAEVIKMVNECFRRYDGLPGCTNTTPNKEVTEEELNEIHEGLDELANVEPYVDDEDNDDNVENMEELLKEAITPLFKDNPTNPLQAVLVLLNND